MEHTIICQSCAMPLGKPEEFGTEANGSASQDYCCYCYQNGAFEEPDTTMEEMIAFCVDAVKEENPEGNLEEVKAWLEEQLPKLKRWAKA